MRLVFAYRWRLFGALALLLLGLVYLSHKAIENEHNFGDVRYFWVAGRTWAAGGNPYSEAFGQIGRRLFPDRFEPLWVYPPHWYPLCRLLALLPHALAASLWMGTSIAALPIASLIGWAALRDRTALGLPAALLLAGTTLVSLPAIMTILYGQSTSFITLGAVCLLFGALRSSRSVLAIGMFLVLLKPNYGIPLCLATFLIPGALSGVLLGTIAVACASLPAFLTVSPQQMLGSMLHDMAAYSAYYINSPPNLVGAFHLLNRGLARPSIVVLLLCCIAPIALAFVAMRARGWPRRDLAPRLFAVALAATLAFALPHEYDLVLSLPIALIAIDSGRPSALLLAALPIAAIRLASLDILSLASVVSVGGALLLSLAKPARTPHPDASSWEAEKEAAA